MIQLNNQDYDNAHHNHYSFDYITDIIATFLSSAKMKDFSYLIHLNTAKNQNTDKSSIPEAKSTVYFML